MSWALPSIGGGLRPLGAPTWSHSRAPEPAASEARPVAARTLSSRHVAPASDRCAGFHVQQWSASDAERDPPRREAVLAAYRTHLAGPIRYFGPLAPVDLWA